MKDKDYLRILQLEDSLKPFREGLTNTHTPNGGWVRAIREALGMTNVQLSRRLRTRAPQSIEDMQKAEVTGAIQLRTLRKLAEAMGCRVVYAVVPSKPLLEMRQERAEKIARRKLQPVVNTMRLEDQGLTSKEEERQLEILIRKLLAGNPKKLWE